MVEIEFYLKKKIFVDRKREKTVAALNKLMTTYQLSGVILLEDYLIK